MEEHVKSSGRPDNQEQKEAFHSIINYVESCNEEIVTINNLEKKMKEKLW